jgi:hypothetical protein
VENYPGTPPPDDQLSPTLLAAKWVSHDLYGEDMPKVAADLLEAGYDSPSLRRLAGETQVPSSAHIETLVGRVFRELGVRYPVSEQQAKIVVTRQIAREVIAGKRNAWAAASHLEIAIWNWIPATLDLGTIFAINDEIDWDSADRRPLSELTSELLDAFAKLAVTPDEEMRL